MLRDWTASEKVNNISIGAEVLFTRLIMKADDFGAYHANVKLINAALFPLKDKITDSNISGWIKELQKYDLIELYSVENKNYLIIKEFGQRLRNMRNAFPRPLNDKLPPNAANDGQLAATRGETLPEVELEENSKRRESESEEESRLKMNAESEFFDLDFIKNKLLIFVWSQERYYVSENTSYNNAFQKFIDVNKIKPNDIIKGGVWRERYYKKRKELAEKYLLNIMRKDINECLDHYSTVNFKKGGEVIKNWESLLKGWLNKKPELGKLK